MIKLVLLLALFPSSNCCTARRFYFYKEELIKGGGGADIAPLNTNLNTPVAKLLPDNQRYFDLHHARSDVFEQVNKRELLLGAINMAALIYLVDKYGL